MPYKTYNYFDTTLKSDNININVAITTFINHLSQFKSTNTVENMYHTDSQDSIERRKRLKEFLIKNQNAKILLVGEAPGYNGCAKTGVPFTSDTNEPSSAIIQSFLSQSYPQIPVLMWNAFPFHPHRPNQTESNRSPNAEELGLGHSILQSFIKLFPNLTYFCAIGRTAEKQLLKINLPTQPIYIRHPAHGGKTKCIKTLDQFFRQIYE